MTKDRNPDAGNPAPDTAPQNVVVVGYDGSDSSRRALHAAAEHARLYGATLRLVTAYVEPPAGYSDGMFGVPSLSAEVVESLKESAQSMVEEAARELGAEHGIEVETLIVHGRPSQALLDASRGTRLLVVGAHGSGAWRRLLLGSTSTEIIHHATVPVLVLH